MTNKFRIFSEVLPRVVWVIKTVRKALASKELIVKGPYKYVRHPMYVSIYFLSFGFGFLFYSWIPFAVNIIFIPIWFMICKVEENQMTLIHGEKYIAYKKNVGMFLPKKRIIINIIILLLVIFSLAIGILFPKTPLKVEESIIINTGPEKINDFIINLDKYYLT